MCIDLLTNPTVIGAIIGAILGAIASATFAIITSWYKFRKRKKGAKALIQSEINYIVNALEKFHDKYLKDEIILDENIMNQELFNFYNIMSNFPIWTDRNWINLITFIPSIFKPKEIDKINHFYAKCEETTDNAKALSEKTPYDQKFIDGKLESEIPTDLNIINSHRNMFRKDLNDLIKLGNEVKEIFK